MMRQTSDEVYRRWQSVLAQVIFCSTIGLIFVGGIVTSKNVGLSVPDWPTSYGFHLWAMPFSMWKGGVFYEHSHRVLASIIGLGVLTLTIWLFFTENRRWVRGLGLACLGVVLLQGLLGGITVLMKLPVAVSVAHGVLGQTFFCLTLVQAYALSRERSERRLEAPDIAPPQQAQRAALVLLVLVFAQLILAAFMRHDMKHHGGVAIPDFPMTAGSWVPVPFAGAADWVNAWRADAVVRHGAGFDMHLTVATYQVWVHYCHRVMACIIILAAVWATRVISRDLGGEWGREMKSLYAFDGVLAVQAVLGVLTVWTSKGALITSLHVVVGAILLALAVLLLLRLLPVAPAEPSR